MTGFRFNSARTRIGDLKIGVRLGAAFGVVVLLLVAVLTVGLTGGDSQASAANAVENASTLTRDVLQAKFRTADFTGWQTAYAFDAFRRVPGALTTGDNRKAFLASADAFRQDLQRVGSHPLTAAEQSDRQQVSVTFDQFMAGDNQVVATFQQGTPAALEAATKMALVDEVNIFQKLATSLDKLVTRVDAQAKAATAHEKSVASSTKTEMLLIGSLAIAVAAACAVWITRSITRPLRASLTMVEAIARKDFTRTIDVRSKDEVGRIGAALNTAVGALRSALAGISDNAKTLATSSEELSAVSEQMSSSSEETASQATVVSAAAEQVSANIGTVAAASEEMTSSIHEIAANATSAAEVATSAAITADATTATVAKLHESSGEIGNVVKLIDSIAEQTNLLALNATIEAARAGEAGKGFAVVAGEVKELAQQTAKATADITGRIEAIQTDTQEAVDAIAQLTAVIGQIKETQTSIASAVEEQTATTNEIGRNVNEAAAGSGEIAGNISGVAAAAQQSSHGAAQGREAAHQLAQLAAELDALAGQFQY